MAATGRGGGLSNTKSMAVTTIQEEDEDIFTLDPKLARKKEKQAAKAK